MQMLDTSATIMTIILHVLNVAPSASDIDVENNTSILGVYETKHDCINAEKWLSTEVAENTLYFWCEPVQILDLPD